MPEKPCNILIVDDSPEDREIARLILEDVPGRRWSFAEEEKGYPALRRLESEDFDCILLDYQLPDMDGIRFLRELSARFGPLRFPVVVLTGSGRTSVAVDAIKAGAQDYLSKDLIRMEALVRTIDNAIDRARLLRERAAQQQQLESSHARLRLLEAAVEATADSILVTDGEMDVPGPRIVFVNKAFTALTGYPPAEVLGQTPRILQGAKTDRAVLDEVRHKLSTGNSFSGEAINYRRDGSEFVMEWAIAPVAGVDRKPTHYVAVQRDATARKTSEQQLRNSEERLALALKGADLGLWDWDVPSGQVVYDSRWAEMLGYDVEEIEPLFSSWMVLVHPDDLPEAERRIEQHLREETTAYEAEFRMRAKTGEWRWILARGKVLSRRPDGSPLRAVGTHLDITDRREAELALRRSNEDLQQFTHIVSHDLQEPLRRMAIYSQLLSRHVTSQLDDDSRGFLGMIESGAQKANHLIDDLLAYAQAGAEKQVALREACPLDEVLAETLSACREEIQRTGALVEHDRLPVLHASRVMLGRLMQNLVGNALKYRKPDVTPHVIISARREGANWVVSVRDNGIGFEQEHADSVFGVFTRLNWDRAGTGMGLAICRRIVERHGGRIWAEAQPGTGATFHFRLPATTELAMAAGIELD